ncbi:trigger factor [Patescibacteria group bacterium]|nr:trigger factor [Patescibacteria group bacterium]
MKSEVKTLLKGQAEISVELSQDDLKPFISQAVAELSSQTTIPGFRPGKAPYEILEKHVGAMRIFQLAAEKAVRKTFPRAVVENKLITVGPPEISLQKIAPGNPLAYKAVVSLLPKVELGDYKNIKVDKKEVKVEDRELSSAIENLRKIFSKEKIIKRQVQKGDKVDMDMDTYVDRVAIDGGQAKSQTIIIGEGQFVPGFEDNLLGLEAGQTKEFQVNFPKEYHRKDLANRPVDFKVKVNNIYEIELPPLDDAFAKMVGRFNTLKDLQEQVQKNIKQEKKMKEQQRWELEVIDKILSKSSFGEAPEVLINSEVHKMMHELEHEISGQGMKFYDYLKSIKKTKEELKLEFVPKAVNRVKTAITLRTIAEKENIEVSEKELDEEVASQNKKYADNEEAIKQINSSEFRDYARNMLRGRKVFEFLENISK